MSEDIAQMMTRRGNTIVVELTKKGWKTVPPTPGIKTNPDLIDPVDGKQYSLEDAEKIQTQRDKEKP